MAQSQNSTVMWYDELPDEKSWSRLWYGYTICGRCRGIRGNEPACRVCGDQRIGREQQVIHLPDGREETVILAAMGAEGRYEDWVYLQMIEREWKRPTL